MTSKNAEPSATTSEITRSGATCCSGATSSGLLLAHTDMHAANCKM
ncbi:hypothetical protein ACFY89_18285 [Achromobacter spanius]